MSVFVDKLNPIEKRYALPVGPLAVSLRRKMQVFSIPSFVILNNRGKVVTRISGSEALQDNPLEICFPELAAKTTEDDES